jgi:hypothetical protein
MSSPLVYLLTAVILCYTHKDLEEPKPQVNTSTVVRTVRIGDRFQSNCTISGEPSPFVQWWRNSTINGSNEAYQEFIGNASITTATLAFDSIMSEDITEFFCSVWYLDVSRNIYVTLRLIREGKRLD